MCCCVQATDVPVGTHSYGPADICTLDALLRLGLPYVSWRESQECCPWIEIWDDAEEEYDEVAFAVIHLKPSEYPVTPLLVAAWLVR